MSNAHFNELPYLRPDLESIRVKLATLTERLSAASTADEAIAVVTDWNALRKEYATMQSLAEVRYTQNVADEARKNEKHFYDENNPTFIEMNLAFEKVLIASPWRPAMETHYGELFFRIIENSLKVFSPAIKDMLVQQSDLTNKYNELTASAKIELDGETYNLSTIGKISIDLDREKRKRAALAQYSFLGSNASALDDIYDKLVKLRTRMATTLGFKNYIEFRYIEFGRVDYNAEDVKVFRQQVIDQVVPLVTKFRAAQAKRLGVDSLRIYDEKLQFADGNPIATGDHDFIVNAATTMYSELAPETKEFFDLMIDRELMDLKSRDNKATGGYCTSFPEFGVPFIFANFNKTTHDVEVLTHEAGHAFQAFRSRNHIVPEYYWPTAEACEIHSMGMEFLTWPWMNQFFGDQTDKFRFYHLQGAILFLPYGCAVDHFQHWVYEHPEVTPAERNAKWKEMESIYMPWRNAEGVPEAMEGRSWQFQRHIFESPFYYIDYALAQTCALQYWAASEEDRTKAFQDYLRICDVGGSQSFLQIVETGNLTSPFAEGCLQGVVHKAHTWLQEHYPQYN